MEDLDSESDLDMTEVWPPVPPATREVPVAEPGFGAGGGGAEGNPPTSSVSPKRADFGGINGSICSSSNDSHTSSDSSNRNDSEDLPALVGRPARDLEVFGELSLLQSGRTRSQSLGLTITASCADALLAYAIRTVEAKRTIEEEAEEIERAHDSLLEERLEREGEGLKELERRDALLKQREEEQDSDCPLAMGVEQQPEVSISSPIGRKPSEVESPPHTVAGVERYVYQKGWDQVVQSESHESGDFLDGRQGTGEA